MPKTMTEAHFKKLPPFLANDKNEGRNRWRWRFDTPERYQEYMKNYYRLATEVDAVCGRIIEELETQGLLEKQVARELGISRHTVHNHIRVIYRAFGVHSRAELLVRVRQQSE